MGKFIIAKLMIDMEKYMIKYNLVVEDQRLTDLDKALYDELNWEHNILYLDVNTNSINE